MALITAERILQLAIQASANLAAQLAELIEAEMPDFGINTPLCAAHFMAQACHESAGFTRFIENLNYTHADRIAAIWPRLESRADILAGHPEAIANAAYANRNGNGSENSGDGWRFRGRGLFQLTGRDAYARAAGDLDRPFVAQPDLVAQPEGAVLTALWFWKKNTCGKAAERDDVKAVTRIINGPALAGLSERAALTEKAKAIFQ